MASSDVQQYLITYMRSLCCDVVDIWEAIRKREGIQLLISFLGLSSEEHQDEDIRACVESAEAIRAFLWFLKTGRTKGQETSGKALIKLIRKADATTINQLLALLWGDTPKSKAHIIEILNSSNEEAQEHATSVLADLFSIRQDICDSLATNEVVHPCMKLLTGNTQIISTQSARALGAMSKNKMSYIVEGDVKPLIKLAKTSSSIDAAETDVSTLAKVKRLLLPTKLSSSTNDGKKITKTDDFT
ncbi:unnamed protein product [Lactuca saligna]|uniref:Uncharacterized protein n=1 Tax=Lactuca saligna TaxID=75948 RepID=A0AA35VGR7_LACSI|nr:unnamed protein product [Lactuca saligna]